MTPEQKARQEIDAQLAVCGWVVQDYRLADFSTSRGIALREVSLTTGPCDSNQSREPLMSNHSQRIVQRHTNTCDPRQNENLVFPAAEVERRLSVVEELESVASATSSAPASRASAR